MFGLGVPELFVLSPLLLLALTVAMFINVMTNKQLDDTSRILWAVALVCFTGFAAVPYYFMHYDGKFAVRKKAHKPIN